ncbi:MAG TPA: TetR family transcriptional regulator [Pseudonocardia sp.]|uniref:TetR/AcrR family transcriptional regulator n=1 Tax=Pseudonocardia sp. TaxID=60912 RepID=UPI002B4B766F|nr:TetR family transcriptional regulator [Pseudonocardia sp.]HLU57714.1 TetR family transcriptional regulator [Pseudonocardia sp.]
MITDGRRLKGRLRRRRLLDATMRVIERAGVAAVSQRVVAQEAAVPPSAVTYYFPTVDDLLVAALADCNDAYLQELEACAHAEDPVAALARLIAKGAGAGRAYVAAEYELFLLAARRPELQAEARRWTEAVDAFLAPLVADPVARAGVAAAVDGLFLRCFVAPDPPGEAEVRAVLTRLIGR